MEGELYAIMRDKQFSLATDDSNSSGDKLFPLVITFFDENGENLNNPSLPSKIRRW